MTRFTWTCAVVAVCLLAASSAWAVDMVEIVDQDNLAPNATVNVRIKISNDEAVRGLTIPLTIRGDAAGNPADSAGTRPTSLRYGWRERIVPGVMSEVQLTNCYNVDTVKVCANHTGGFYKTQIATDTFGVASVTAMPLGLLFQRTRIFSQNLTAGADTEGSIVLIMQVNDQEGCFIIDSACVSPANHLFYTPADGVPLKNLPSFDKGYVCVGIDACANSGLAAPELNDPTRDPGQNVVTFSWGAVPNAADYTIEIDTIDANFTAPFYTKTLTETEDIVILDFAALDRFFPLFWRVRANPVSAGPSLSAEATEVVPTCPGPWSSLEWTSVKTIASSVLPESYSLDQNYPNPFNASTVINFTNLRDGHVTLQVFNILGQPVVTLVDEYKPLGVYSVDWNGRDASGHEVSSGMYFYRFTSQDFSSVKKMTVLK